MGDSRFSTAKEGGWALMRPWSCNSSLQKL